MTTNKVGRPKVWARFGNAVPPPMMKAVADTIRTDILGKIT